MGFIDNLIPPHRSEKFPNLAVIFSGKLRYMKGAGQRVPRLLLIFRKHCPEKRPSSSVKVDSILTRTGVGRGERVIIVIS